MLTITCHRPRTTATARQGESRSLVEVFTCGPFSEAHPTDALRRLLRQLVKAGLSGPAEVRGEDGRLRLVVRSIEGAATLTMTEGDKTGLKLLRWKPAPAEQQARWSALQQSAKATAKTTAQHRAPTSGQPAPASA